MLLGRCEECGWREGFVENEKGRGKWEGFSTWKRILKVHIRRELHAALYFLDKILGCFDPFSDSHV